MTSLTGESHGCGSYPAPADGWLWEITLAAGLGVAPEVLIERRGIHGRDWLKTGRGTHDVHWSPEASEALLQALAGVSTLPVKRVHAVTVARADFVNRKIMHGVFEGQTVVVRVSNASLFVPGMMVLAEHFEGATWDYRGNPDCPEKGCKLPRRKGVW